MAMFNDYIALVKDNPSVLMVSKKNVDRIELNAMARKALQDLGVVSKQDVEFNVSRRVKGSKKETFVQMMFAAGDMIVFKEKSKQIEIKTDDGEIRQAHVYNNNIAKIVSIDGTGPAAKITARLFDGDKPGHETITFSVNDFRNGVGLPVDLFYCATAAGAQGKSYDHKLGMADPSYSKQEALVIATRHRKSMHLYGDMKSLFDAAERHFDATAYTTRNKFTESDALKVLGASWQRNHFKATTIDYMMKDKILEQMGYVQNPTKPEAIAAQKQTAAKDELRVANDVLAQPILPNARRLQNLRAPKIWNADRSQFVPVPTSSENVIKQSLITAARKFGNILHPSGSDAFHQKVANVLSSAAVRNAIGRLQITSKKTIKAVRDVVATIAQRQRSISPDHDRARAEEAALNSKKNWNASQQLPVARAEQKHVHVETPEPPKPSRKRGQERRM